MVAHANVSEGGIFIQGSPLKSQMSLLLVQTVLIISLSRLLHVGLAKLRQPRVIAEIVGGICLGPSVLGNIPGFTATIFPNDSLDFLQALSNIGLVLYLFLVGLELNPATIFRDLRSAIAISAAGIIAPFGLGAAVSYGLHHTIGNDANTAPLSSFVLFIGVVMSITAFPVLTRILSEFKLLSTPVGLLAVTAAAVDDVCAWALLAMVVSIMNGGDNLAAVYIILVAIAYSFLLLLPIRLFFRAIFRRARKSETFNHILMAAILICVFVSAWIAEMIGINAIFGGFLMGFVVPRDRGLIFKLTENIEDLVSIVFLPLFFAWSGLKTQFSLLSDGMAWLWLFVVILVACTGKIGGCTVIAKMTGNSWREAISVGILMNTKGFVGLIVLNIGLDTHVINEKIFVIMIVMALVTTFLTSPLLSLVYPPSMRKQLVQVKSERNVTESSFTPDIVPTGFDNIRLLLYVDAFESAPIVAPFLARVAMPEEKISLHALKIVETSDRSTAILYASMACCGGKLDPALQVASFIGHSKRIPTTTSLSQSPISQYGDEVNAYGAHESCNLLLIPWHYGIDADAAPPEISSILTHASITTGVYIDSERDSESWFTKINEPANNRILVPFAGGADDREALRLALRLHRCGGAVVHVQVEPTLSTSSDQLEDALLLENIESLAQSNEATLVISSNEPSAELKYGLIIVGRSKANTAAAEGVAAISKPEDGLGSSKRCQSIQGQMQRTKSKAKAISNRVNVFGKFESKLLEANTPVLIVSREMENANQGDKAPIFDAVASAVPGDRPVFYA